MGAQIDTKNPLYAWLRVWNAVTHYDRDEGFLSPDLLPPELDVFRANPSEESFLNALTTLKNKHSNFTLFFEEHAHNLWFKFRAQKLKIWKDNNKTPQVFYQSDLSNRKATQFLSPAPADKLNAPDSYRNETADVIFRLLHELTLKQKIDDAATTLPPEKVVVVFSHVNTETRQVVIPKLVSKFEDTPHFYIRITPKFSGASHVDPTEHIDPTYMKSKKLLKHPFLNDSPNNAILILDFLDFHDWTNSGYNRWPAPHHPLLKKLNSGFLKKGGNRLLFLLNSDPFSYQKKWESFLPFLKALNINQPNVFAVGLHPKLMNEQQAAEFLGLGPTDIRLIASRVPLLFSTLLEVKSLLLHKSSEESLDDIIKKAIGIIPPADNLIATASDELHAVPSEMKLSLVERAIRPQFGHDLTLLDLPSHRKRSKPPNTPKKTGSGEPLKPSGKTKRTPSIAAKYFNVELTPDRIRKIYDNSPTLQTISARHLKKTKGPTSLLIKAVIKHRSDIAQELYKAKGVITEGYTDYSLTALIKVLVASNKNLEEHAKTYEQQAFAHDLWDRSPLLRKVRPTDFETERELLAKLMELKQRIVAEQQKTNGFGPHNYKLNDFVQALIAGGVINGHEVLPFLRLIPAYELLSGSPTLRNVSDDVLQDDFSVMRFALTFRDRIAVENLKAQGKLGPDEFIFPNAWRHYPLPKLLNALHAAGRIDRVLYDRLSSSATGPMEHFLARRKKIESEVRRIGSGQGDIESVERSKFMHLKNPSERLRIPYVQLVIRWGWWFMNDPEVSKRSIYTADEIASIVFNKHKRVINGTPGNIAERLKKAAQPAKKNEYHVGARNQVISILIDVLDHYEQARQKGETFDEKLEYSLKKINQLVEWNRDEIDPHGNNGNKGNNTPPVKSSGSSSGGIINEPQMPGTLAMPLIPPLIPQAVPPISISTIGMSIFMKNPAITNMPKARMIAMAP